jgi:predicted DNA-binding WGR domain protein
VSAAQARQSGNTTYLELSQESGGAHKFYEVTVEGTTVSVRYGRIGVDGQRQTSAFPTVEKANAAAAKKIAEKVRKGYAPAVQGQRAARAVTRRQVTSAPSTARATAPVLWRFRTGASAFGIHVDEDRCWVGNQHGSVYNLSHDGEVLAHYSLPDGVKCLVADDFWIYAGCDDGRVYDLSSKVPFAAYEIAAEVDIFWLDIHAGVLNVSDRNGGLTVIDHEDELQWSRNSSGDNAWMVRADDHAVYHGHSRGVTAYAADGTSQLWHTATNGNVLFGWQEENAVYAGTGRRVVQRLAKSTGRAIRLRGRLRLLRLLLHRRRHPAVEARHGRRLGAVHAVPRRTAVHRLDGRLAGLHRRERGRDQRRPVGHRPGRRGHQTGGRPADVRTADHRRLRRHGQRRPRTGERGRRGVHSGRRPSACARGLRGL